MGKFTLSFRWLPVMILVVSLVVLSGCLSPGGQQATDASKSTAARASDFTLSDLDGNEVSLSDLRGQAVLLNFWATW